MRLFHDRLKHRERQHKADLIDAIAHGYSACKSTEGSKAVVRIIEALRKP